MTEEGINKYTETTETSGAGGGRINCQAYRRIQGPERSLSKVGTQTTS